jgi:hypothetical protein
MQRAVGNVIFLRFYLFQIKAAIADLTLNKKNKKTMNLCSWFFYGGDKEIRTLDPLRARQVLSQLSYTPVLPGINPGLVDLQGLEPRTNRL